MRVKVKEGFNYLLDETKILLPQLGKIKRTCFRPYVSNLQLIKFCCEKCSEEGKYSSCLFYEATHLDCFAEQLAKIQADKSITPPKKFHPDAERLCYGRTSLEKILRGTWAVFQHNTPRPTWEEGPDWREWNKKHKEIQKRLPCESTCKMSKWCAFYQNGVNYQLLFTDLTGYDENGLTYAPYSDKFDKGFRVGSYFYKHFVKHSAVKELPPIETEPKKIPVVKNLDKLKKTHLEVCGKILRKVNFQPRAKVVVPKFVLDLLLKRENGGELALAWLIGLRHSYNVEQAWQRWQKPYPNLVVDLQKHFKTLKELELTGTLTQLLTPKRVRDLAERFFKPLDDVSTALLEVDLVFLAETLKQRKLKPFDLFYEFYLSLEKNPTRKEAEEKFKLSQTTLVEAERRLGVKKVFRALGTAQICNKYAVNTPVLEGVFRFLTANETKEIFEKQKIKHSVVE